MIVQSELVSYESVALAKAFFGIDGSNSFGSNALFHNDKACHIALGPN